ncbi:MAG TPA: ABC transporter permease, partial [Gemmataceae bacterium]|nr:ABC transporter permease [Gemmataceae bacterium]
MSLLSALRVALGALLVHKGRSALTSLGIVIGIAAVIAMVAAGGGAREMLDERLDNVGKNLILVRAGAYRNGTLADLKPLTSEDANVIRKHLGERLVGVAEVQVTQRVASTRTHNHATAVVGSVPDMKAVRRWIMQYGRFYDADDFKKQAAVCLIGQTVREKLFPDRPNPIGQLVRIDRLHLRVIGVLAPKGRSPTGEDQDNQI